MKQECKKAPDREVRYVAFKSYHAKAPASSATAAAATAAAAVTAPALESSAKVATKSDLKDSNIDQNAKLSSSAAAAVKKSRKKAPTASKHKGDSVEQQIELRQELSRTRRRHRDAEFQDALTTLRAENESLKQSLSQSVASDTYQRLQQQLLESTQKCSRIEAELQTAQEQNEGLQRRVDELTENLEEANRECAELSDRVELGIDQIQYLEQKVAQLKQTESQAQSLQHQLQTLAAQNEQLVAENARVTGSLHDLETLAEELRVKLEDLANVKRKLKSKESELQKAMDEKEVGSKFVELMESENTNLKGKNGALVEQNARLNKDLAEMKKKTEQLRQKFDDVNKENKLLKEKEARYLIHERINVGKYSSSKLLLSTLADREDQSRVALTNLRPSTTPAAAASSVAAATAALPNSSIFRPSGQHPATAMGLRRRAKNANNFDERLHNLLHRPGSDERISKTKQRKH